MNEQAVLLGFKGWLTTESPLAGYVMVECDYVSKAYMLTMRDHSPPVSTHFMAAARFGTPLRQIWGGTEYARSEGTFSVLYRALAEAMGQTVKQGDSEYLIETTTFDIMAPDSTDGIKKAFIEAFIRYYNGTLSCLAHNHITHFAPLLPEKLRALRMRTMKEELNDILERTLDIYPEWTANNLVWTQVRQ